MPSYAVATVADAATTGVGGWGARRGRGSRARQQRAASSSRERVAGMREERVEEKRGT